MTVTLRVFGLEILHLEASTEDDTAEPEYDHDVGSATLEAVPTGALGFTSPAVEVDE